MHPDEVDGNSSDWERYPIASSPMSVSVTFSVSETCSSVILPWELLAQLDRIFERGLCCFAKVGGNKNVTHDELLAQLSR